MGEVSAVRAANTSRLAIATARHCWGSDPTPLRCAVLDLARMWVAVPCGRYRRSSVRSHPGGGAGESVARVREVSV
jgi:hypothetical protein